MMILRVTFLLLLTTGTHGAISAQALQASGCTPFNRRFTSLIKKARDADRQRRLGKLTSAQSYETWKVYMGQALTVLEDAIGQQLARGAQTAEVEKTIQCVEQPYVVDPGMHVTNTPLAIPFRQGTARGYVIGFMVAGGSYSPSVARLELWTDDRGAWSRVSWVGADWDNCSFNIILEPGAKPGRQWILLYGQMASSTARGFQLIENTGKTLVSLWGPLNFPRTVVRSVTDGKVVMRQEIRDDNEKKETIYEVITYRITASGLRKIASVKQTEPWFPHGPAQQQRGPRGINE